MASAFPPQAFVNIVGGFILGSIFNTLALGITLSQAFQYFRAYSREDKFFYLVATLTFIVVVHSAITIHTAYYWGVQNFANPAILAISPWSFTVEPIFTGVVAAIVQSFYAFRVYAVSNRRRILPAIILILSAVQLGWAVGASAEIFRLNSQFDQFATWTYGVLTWLSAAAACDIIITASLSYYLHNAKSEYGRTNTIIDKIIARTIQTNSLSMVAAVANMALFAIPSSGTWHVLFQLQLVPLYTLSCLVSLNSRNDIASDLAAVGPSISMGDITHAGTRKKSDAGLGNGRATKRNGEIPVHVVTMTDSEEFDDYARKDLESASFHNRFDSVPATPPRRAGEENWN